MSKPLPTRTLPAKPDLDQVKRQAKELLQKYRSGNPDAVAEVARRYQGADPETFALHNAQLVLARSYGFDSWPKLKAFIDGVTVERLAAAARAGDLNGVESMIRARPELVNMDMSETNEHRPIHYAVMARAPEMVRLLMQHGADANKGIHPRRGATTAMTIARERGYDDIVAIIEQAEQRRVEEKSAAGSTAANSDQLARAIMSGDKKAVIEKLDAEPALINTPNRRVWTPLHVAAATRDLAIVQLLLDRKANPGWLDPNGRTPLDNAVGGGWHGPVKVDEFLAVAELLRAAGAMLTVRAAVALADADHVRRLKAEGLLVNPIALGWTAPNRGSARPLRHAHAPARPRPRPGRAHGV